MHFLILKTSSLGDILHTFPALAYLRRKFPHATIDWVVESPFAELVSSHPFVDKVFTVNTKKWRKSFFSLTEVKKFSSLIRDKKYDVVFDFQGNIKSSLILSMIRAKIKAGFGRKSVHEWFNLLFTNYKSNPPLYLNIREDNLFLVQNFFKDSSKYVDECITLKCLNDPIFEIIKSFSYRIMVCPGAFWENKRASDETLKRLLHAILQKRGEAHFFFTWGTELEREMVNNLAKSFASCTILPRLALPLLQNVMNMMDLVIAMDSLPLHLAATTRTSTLSLFGPSSGEKFAPKGPRHHFFQGTCPYNVTFKKRCPKLRVCNTGACIKNMDPKSLQDFLDKNLFSIKRQDSL